MSPIYEYQCIICGEVFEKHVSVKMRDKQSCPHCLVNATMRLAPTPVTITGGPTPRFFATPESTKALVTKEVK